MSLGAVIMLLIALFEHDMKSMFGVDHHGHGDEHIHEAVQHASHEVIS